MLPAEEEAHEIGGADRLDLGAQPVQRVAVDACEQRAVAPFERRLTRREASPQHDAVGLEQQEGRVRIRRRDAERIGQRRRGDGPGQRQPASAAISAMASPRVQAFASRDAGGWSGGGTAASG